MTATAKENTMEKDHRITANSCTAPVFAWTRVYLTVMAVLFMLYMPICSSRCVAAEAYTAEEQALIDLLRLPTAPVNSEWSYNAAFFDELRWDTLGNKTKKRKELLATVDPDKNPEAAADTLRELATLLGYQGKKQDAVPYAKKATVLYQGLIEKEPRNAQLLYKLALVQNIATTASDTSHASHATFEAAVKADPDYCLPYLELIDAGTGTLSWMDRAGECVKRAIAKEPKKAEHYYTSHLYECSAGVMDLLDMRTSVQAASTGYGSLMKLYLRMAGDQSIDALRKAVDLDPENIKYRASLAGVLSLRNYLEWFNQVEALLKTEPSIAAAMKQATTITRKKNKKRHAEAEEHFQYVEKKSKDEYPPLYMLWSILPMTDGKLGEAEQFMLRAIALDPLEGSYYQTLLFLCINDEPSGQQVKFKQVADLMEKKCTIKCSADERRIIARIRFGEKNYRETERQLRLALVEDPASFPIRTGLAVSLFKMNRVEEGMTELRAAEPFGAKAEAADKAHYFSFAAVLSMLEGDVETAKQRIQKSLELDPDDPVANELVIKLRGQSAATRAKT